MRVGAAEEGLTSRKACLLGQPKQLARAARSLFSCCSPLEIGKTRSKGVSV